MPAHFFERRLELAVAVEHDDRHRVGAVQRLLHSGDDAFAARADETAGPHELEQQNLVDLTGPAGLRPLAQIAAGEQPRLIIVGAEVRRARMRNVDGDERNVRFEILRRDRWRHGFVGLKLDDEVDLLLDEMLGVAQRNLRLIAVIDDDQLETLALGGPYKPGMHLTRERAVLAL